MYRQLGCLLLTAGCIGAAVGAPPESMLHAEYAAFRAMEHGGDQEMLPSVDTQAVSYYGKIKDYTNVYQVMAETHTTPGPTRRMIWQPQLAVIAASGDYGVISGSEEYVVSSESTYRAPFSFYRDFIFGFNSGLWTAKRAPWGAPRRYYADYINVWQRSGTDQAWRIIQGFFGVQHDRPDSWSPILDEDSPAEQLASMVSSGPGQDPRAAMVAADTSFSALGIRYGQGAAYVRVAAAQLHLFRSGQLPVIGRQAVADIMATVPAVQWVPSGASAAASGDLGCTYGFTYELNDTAHAVKQHMYVHIWRREKDHLELLVALVGSL